jgi:hypothetical protein
MDSRPRQSSVLEDAKDYMAFEAAVTADYDAQSAVERELVLRLASILWRLRRANTMETGLFEIQTHGHDYRQNQPRHPDSLQVIPALFRWPDSANAEAASHDSRLSIMEQIPDSRNKLGGSTVEFARCFLGLANLPNFALDRLSRYEATLWRQAKQILYALEVLDRRKPPERTQRRFPIDHRLELPGYWRHER